MANTDVLLPSSIESSEIKTTLFSEVYCDKRILMLYVDNVAPDQPAQIDREMHCPLDFNVGCH